MPSEIIGLSNVSSVCRYSVLDFVGFPLKYMNVTKYPELMLSSIFDNILV